MSDPIEELRKWIKTGPWVYGPGLDVSKATVTAYDAKCAELERLKQPPAASPMRMATIDYLKELRAELEKVNQRLRAYEKQWTEMDYTIGVCRQQLHDATTALDKVKAERDELLTRHAERVEEKRELTTALDSELAANAGLRDEVLSLKADIETAILALRNSYDATEWPADGTSGCELAAKALEERLNSAPTTETKGGK